MFFVLSAFFRGQAPIDVFTHYMTKTRFVVILAIVCLNPASLIFVWMNVASYYERNPTRAFHQASVKWLPKEATDVSEYSTYNTRMYDCIISDAGFKALADKNEWAYLDIRDAFTVIPTADYDTYRDEKTDSETRDRLQVMVVAGYYYKTLENDGGGLSIIYDRLNKRLYFRSTIR